MMQLPSLSQGPFYVLESLVIQIALKQVNLYRSQLYGIINFMTHQSANQVHYIVVRDVLP